MIFIVGIAIGTFIGFATVCCLFVAKDSDGEEE